MFTPEPEADRIIRRVVAGFLFGKPQMEIACSDPCCEYQLGAYDQDEQRHREGRPHYQGLCLNHIDDQRKADEEGYWP
jgi:hypothetical protein